VLPAGFPEIIGGKYRPIDVLGTGGTGTVYSVEHTFTGEVLALKVMRGHLDASSDAIARFKREAQAVSKIRSEHVVRIFDADVALELGRSRPPWKKRMDSASSTAISSRKISF
jgi:serine/threonine-protein kinase